jgi:cell division protein FtsQ
MSAVKQKRSARGRRKWWDFVRRHRRVLWRASGAAAIAAAIGAAGSVYWFTDIPARALALARSEIADQSVALGLTVQEVRLSGRVETEADAILAALGVPRDTPIFLVDLAQARERLQGLEWVKEARIARRLPSTISVQLVERTPFAIWQNRGVRALIDRDGEVMVAARIERWGHLPVVVGAGAPRAAAALLDVLAVEPTLQSRVAAAIRVGERRWNLRFDNGVEVLLPEDDAAGAWRRFADWQRTHGVLERAVSTIDLRFADRLLLRLTPDAGPVLRDPGENT